MAEREAARPRTSPRTARLLRKLGYDRNPLRRRIDRIQAGLTAALIVLFLITAPILATTAGHWVRAAGLRQQHAERAWRQVTATVQHPAPARGSEHPSGKYARAARPAWVPARWTAPDGQHRSGLIPASPHIAGGRGTLVWVNRSGALTGPPLQPAELAWRPAAAEALAAYLLAVALWTLADIACAWFDRRRLDRWTDEWQLVAPLWTRQQL